MGYDPSLPRVARYRMLEVGDEMSETWETWKMLEMRDMHEICTRYEKTTSWWQHNKASSERLRTSAASTSKLPHHLSSNPQLFPASQRRKNKPTPTLHYDMYKQSKHQRKRQNGQGRYQSLRQRVIKALPPPS